MNRFRYIAVATVFGSYAAAPARGERLGPEQWKACGPLALHACCRIAGVPATVEQVRVLCGVDSHGSCSLADISRAAKALGIHHATPVRMTIDDVYRLSLLAIVRDNTRTPPHFLAVVGQRNNGLLVMDPPRGPYWIPTDRAASLWDGYAVLLSQAPIPGVIRSAGGIGDAAIPLGAGAGLGAIIGLATALARRRGSSEIPSTVSSNGVPYPTRP